MKYICRKSDLIKHFLNVFLYIIPVHVLVEPDQQMIPNLPWPNPSLKSFMTLRNMKSCPCCDSTTVLTWNQCKVNIWHRTQKKKTLYIFITKYIPAVCTQIYIKIGRKKKKPLNHLQPIVPGVSAVPGAQEEPLHEADSLNSPDLWFVLGLHSSMWVSDKRTEAGGSSETQLVAVEGLAAEIISTWILLCRRPACSLLRPCGLEAFYLLVVVRPLRYDPHCCLQLRLLGHWIVTLRKRWKPILNSLVVIVL